MKTKMNCWEYMKCGREPGGRNEPELGVCPASVSPRFDGTNGGKFAGRFCWRVAGTYCNGEIQGTFAAKILDCIDCAFFLEVAAQEGKRLVFTK